jgi:hypothetical protein
MVQRLEEEDPDPVRVYVRVVGLQSLVDEVVELRGRLDAGGAPPDNHEGQLGFRDLAPHQRDLLETFDHPVANLLGVLDTPHGEGVLLDAGDAEEVGLSTQGDHEMVIRELHPTVDRGRLVHVVYLPERSPTEAGAGRDQGTPQGLGDVATVYIAAYDPRHHRPEGKEIVLGDDEDTDVFTISYALADLFSGGKPAEASAHDEDLVLELVVSGLLPGSVPGTGVECSPERP